MRRFILSLLIMLFALSASAGENVLGTTGNESLFYSLPGRLHTDSTFVGDLQAAGTYTYDTDTDCLDVLGSNKINRASGCANDSRVRRVPKDITFTRLSVALGSALSGSSNFGCKMRLWFGDGDGGFAGSEITIAGELSAGYVATTSFSHRVAAGTRYGIQVANADGCAAGSSCVCGESSGQTLHPYVYGVDH